jgi:hypothetical protein
MSFVAGTVKCASLAAILIASQAHAANRYIFTSCDTGASTLGSGFKISSIMVAS